MKRHLKTEQMSKDKGNFRSDDVRSILREPETKKELVDMVDSRSKEISKEVLKEDLKNTDVRQAVFDAVKSVENEKKGEKSKSFGQKVVAFVASILRVDIRF